MSIELNHMISPARSGRQPSVHRRTLITWMSVYPAITAVQLALGRTVAGLPLPVRTLIVTALVVPAVVYLLVPVLLWLDATVTRHSQGRVFLPRSSRAS